MCCPCIADLCLVIVSVLFPPLPVWIRRGICSADSFINVLLCFLGYLPGLIHSWYIIAKYPPYTSNYDSKVYYVYQNSADLESQTHHHHHHHHHHHNSNYNHAGDNTARPVSVEPSRMSSPNYGSTNESTLREGTSSDVSPPAYSEFASRK